METVQLKKEQLLTAFNEGNESEKSLLKRLYPEVFKSEKRGLEVTTFKIACETEGEDPNDPKFHTGTPDDIAYQMIKVFTRAINPKGWKADYENERQEKWFPWFMANKPGFRFGASTYAISTTLTTGGSRHCFESEERSTHAGNTFLDIYKKYYL